MITIFAAAVGYLLGGLAGAAWAVVILYGLLFLIAIFGS
jgi:hypothetical protein